jgi:hypothetical protein
MTKLGMAHAASRLMARREPSLASAAIAVHKQKSAIHFP